MKYRAIVVDTNVIVAGILTSDPNSPTVRILDGMLQSRIPFLVSEPLLVEYRQVLLRPKIKARHRLDEDEIDRILTTLAANAIVRAPEGGVALSPSPADQYLWDLLACESQSILVSGDRLLLDNPPQIGRAASPARFVETLAG